MPFKPSLRSIWTLIILAVVMYGLYGWCEFSRIERPMKYFDEKIAAAELMDRALTAYQGGAVTVTEETDEEEETDIYGDPRLEAVIGQQFSVITTSIGNFDSKLIGANPNIAAVAVDLLKKADVQKGDLVAVGFTGSDPGVNTAVLCACEIIGATPVTITAVGSSWWGANSTEFTWLDMERTLNEEGLVHSKPIAASFGGARDLAFGLSKVGGDAIREAIRRNGLQLIEERNVPASVARRVEFYRQFAGSRTYKAYVNVGDGIASLGHEENGELIPTGYNKRLPIRNFPSRGVVHVMNSAGIPIINLFNIPQLSRTYGLGGPQVPLPPVGQGEVFATERYDLRVAAAAVLIAAVVIFILVKLDTRLYRLREAGVDPDTLM